MLGEITDAKGFGASDRAFIENFLISEDFKKRRFSGAVRADHSDVFTFVDRKIGVIKKELSAVGFGSLLKLKKITHSYFLRLSLSAASPANALLKIFFGAGGASGLCSARAPCLEFALES